MYSQLPTNWEGPREEKENFTLDKTFLACRNIWADYDRLLYAQLLAATSNLLF